MEQTRQDFNVKSELENPETKVREFKTDEANLEKSLAAFMFYPPLGKKLDDQFKRRAEKLCELTMDLLDENKIFFSLKKENDQMTINVSYKDYKKIGFIHSEVSRLNFA